MKIKRMTGIAFVILVVASLLVVPAGAAPAPSASLAGKTFTPVFTSPVAFDVSPTLKVMAAERQTPAITDEDADEKIEAREVTAVDQPFVGDGAAQTGPLPDLPAISGPLANFEGLSNQDNFNIFGFRVNPPDPVGDVGPNHYVEMVNLTFAVYSKSGTLLLGPVDTGTLWANFPVEDCTDPSGDPIVLYDQLADRWLLSQFTTRGLSDPNLPNYDCVAISQTGDPTGAYYRYAFMTQPDLVDGGYFFPDYPKYGVWTNSYIMTTRDFGWINRYGISVYALEKNKMLAGNPNARAVQFFLDSDVVPISLMGDGLLPPDIDGNRRPLDGTPAPIVGTQDNNGPYGATFDALNIFDLSVQWKANPTATLTLSAQLPVASFDSIFPCAPTSRDCLPQPGITNPTQYLDILSYRQRPTYRLAYRNMGKYEALVTTQSVEAMPGVAGMRWYEIRRTFPNPQPNNSSQYSVYQQGTFAPNDGVHRWMGSVAMDWQGNMALGYSVVNGTNVYPGIRYTGRLAGDPAGQMTLGEGTIIDGTGVQRTTNSRWGDYTSLNVDPVDDCTFWYVNEYYSAASSASSTAGWLTRIGSFKMPGCVAK